jgi:hypothetical protein
MSVDPNTLRKEDRVSFGGKVVKEVNDVYEYPEWKTIEFKDRSSIRSTDQMWKIAELVKLRLPDLLYLAKLDDSGCYYGVHGIAVPQGR